MRLLFIYREYCAVLYKGVFFVLFTELTPDKTDQYLGNFRISRAGTVQILANTDNMCGQNLEISGPGDVKVAHILCREASKRQIKDKINQVTLYTEIL